MDEPHHHTNDPNGTFASARAARDELARIDERKAARDQELPGLQDRKRQILAEKAEAAEQLRQIQVRVGGRDPVNAAEAAERQPFIDKMRACNIELDSLNAAIDKHGPEIAACDAAAHREDLRRRVGAV